VMWFYDGLAASRGYQINPHSTRAKSFPNGWWVEAYLTISAAGTENRYSRQKSPPGEGIEIESALTLMVSLSW